MPIPALIAGGLALGGLVSNYLSNKDKNDRTEAAYNDIKDMAALTAQQNDADIAAYRQMLQSTYGSNASKYNKALEDYLNSTTYQNKDFSYGEDVSKFYDPAAALRSDAAMEAIRGDAGDVFSSDYYNRMAEKQQALASEEYAKAWDRMQADRSQALREYDANSNNSWNNYNAVQKKLQDAVNQYGADRTALTGGIGDATVAGMNNRTANLQSQTNAIAGLTNAQNSEQSVLGGLVGPAMQFLGSYYGAN